ncbi:hypothetical protein [Cupriavidus necator]
MVSRTSCSRDARCHSLASTAWLRFTNQLLAGLFFLYLERQQASIQFKPTIADLDYFGMTLQLRACEGIVQEIREHTHSELETTQTHRGHLSNVELVMDPVQNVWLRLADDSEGHVSVGGVSLPMRAGHRLRAYYAARSPGERGTLVAVKNFTTGEVVDTINRFQPLPSPGWRQLSIMRQLGAGLAVALVFVAAFLGRAPAGGRGAVCCRRLGRGDRPSTVARSRHLPGMHGGYLQRPLTTMPTTVRLNGPVAQVLQARIQLYRVVVDRTKGPRCTRH